MKRLAAMSLSMWCLIVATASAHGLLARVRTEGRAIVATAYYSSGDPAGGEWVEIFDESAGGAKVAEFSAGADGSFRYEGTGGHQYRLAIHGDEGHFIELAIAVKAGARATLVEDQARPPERDITDLPAWLVVGAALGLVSILAGFHRLRGFARGAKHRVST